jgi:hypothetical protein
MGLTRDLQDQRLPGAFSDGEVAQIKVLVVRAYSEHEDCRGLVYDIISTNRPIRVGKGAACWADSKSIADLRLSETKYGTV